MPKPRPSAAGALRRDGAGRYLSADGRFAVDQAAGGWMVTDSEHRDELGLPLVRGPYRTLADAKAAIEAIREGPAPASVLAERIAALPKRPPVARGRARLAARPPRRSTIARDEPVEAPDPEPVRIREWRSADGEALRRLWRRVDMLSPWGDDDDHGLAAMAGRNPGLVLVATSGDEIVGSALGAWDGRRGWIYHVATAPEHRRRGIARDLVSRIEAGLGVLGCPKVNVMVLDDNAEGIAFWTAMGYTTLTAHQFGRRLADPASRRPEKEVAT
jgi:ribosomal protein S18 acetylase RimI-like enzyme